MRIFVTDAEFIQGHSGAGLRFTISLASGADLVWSIEGCLAFRNKKGQMRFLPPVIYIGPKRHRYRNNRVSPKLCSMIEDALELEYGRAIKRDDGKGAGPSSRSVRRYDPDMKDVIEIGVD
jgi:hypothetical protein